MLTGVLSKKNKSKGINKKILDLPWPQLVRSYYLVNNLKM